MRNIIISIFTFLLLSYINTEAQVVDSTQWINYVNDSLGISFNYPDYFDINPLGYIAETREITYLEYLRYSPEEVKVNPSEIIYLELYSTLKIYISDLSFDKIVEENNFIRKDDKWFDNENPYEEPADTSYYSNWKGLSSRRNTSIGIKGGGTWTSAADEEVLLLIKEIGKNRSIVCYAKGFDFPNARDVLEKICNSIIIIHR